MSDHASPDTALAVEFLQRWLPEGPWPLCAFHEVRDNNDFRTFTPENLSELPVWLDEQNEEQRNVYFHVNPVSQPENGKALKNDVLRMEWLHVDVDPAKGQEIRAEQKRILKLLQADDMLPPATVITFSGGG